MLKQNTSDGLEHRMQQLSVSETQPLTVAGISEEAFSLAMKRVVASSQRGALVESLFHHICDAAD
jgi:hypothetical protein